MRSVVTLITAVAFVLHALLGCCAHHAHANEAAACLNHAQALNDSHIGYGHADTGYSPVNSDSQCPGQHRNDCHCVFMAAGKIVVAKAAFTAALPLSLELISPPDLTSSLAATAIDSGGQIKLPVRIHLYNQVLLI